LPRDAAPVSRRYPVSRSLLSDLSSLGKSTNAVFSDSYTSLPTGSGYSSVGGGASSGAGAAWAAGGGLPPGRARTWGCGWGGAVGAAAWVGAWASRPGAGPLSAPGTPRRLASARISAVGAGVVSSVGSLDFGSNE